MRNWYIIYPSSTAMLKIKRIFIKEIYSEITSEGWKQDEKLIQPEDVKQF